MKTFISDLIPKIKRYSQQLDNLTLLTNQHWIVVDDNSDTKHVYIFRSNNELLISQNGRVEKAKWEYLGNDTLLIDRKDESLLFRHGFFDENILALKTDGKAEYAFFINETKSSAELNSIEHIANFLQHKYFPIRAFTTGSAVTEGSDKSHIRAVLNSYSQSDNLTSRSQEFTLKEELATPRSSYESEVRLEDGRFLQIIKDLGYYSGLTEVKVNHVTPEDGFYRLAKSNIAYEIQSGKLKMEYYIDEFKQDDGKVIEIGGNRISGIVKNSPVWLNRQPAPDGVYKKGWFSKVKVKNGRIV